MENMKTGTISVDKGMYKDGWKGIYAEANLSTKQIAFAIRGELKKEFPECRFSITTEYFAGGSAINVRLQSGPFESIIAGKSKSVDVGHRIDEYSKEYNDAHPRSEQDKIYYGEATVLSDEVIKVMKRVNAIVNSFNHDYSDAQMDYSDVNFYSHIQIGQWDKPFINTK
jgi:hypothetical protein